MSDYVLHEGDCVSRNGSEPELIGVVVRVGARKNGDGDVSVRWHGHASNEAFIGERINARLTKVTV